MAIHDRDRMIFYSFTYLDVFLATAWWWRPDNSLTTACWLHDNLTIRAWQRWCDDNGDLTMTAWGWRPEDNSLMTMAWRLSDDFMTTTWRLRDDWIITKSLKRWLQQNNDDNKKTKITDLWGWEFKKLSRSFVVKRKHKTDSVLLCRGVVEVRWTIIISDNPWHLQLTLH